MVVCGVCVLVCIGVGVGDSHSSDITCVGGEVDRQLTADITVSAV
jgi:hypothetical protein